MTIYTEKKFSPQVDEVDQLILAALKEGEGLSTKQLAERVKLSTRATRSRLIILVGRGLVGEIGASSKDPKRKYYLAE